MKFLKEYIDIINENHSDVISENANITKLSFKNVPVNMWISAETKAKKIPRIKVQQDTQNKINPNNFCSITISDDPYVIAGNWKLDKKIQKEVFELIVKCKDVLLTIWQNETDKMENMEILKSLLNS